jgi:hypothetical protein
MCWSLRGTIRASVKEIWHPEASRLEPSKVVWNMPAIAGRDARRRRVRGRVGRRAAQSRCSGQKDDRA